MKKCQDAKSSYIKKPQTQSGQDSYDLSPEAIAKTILIPLAETFDGFSRSAGANRLIMLQWILAQKELRKALNHIFWHKTPEHSQSIADRLQKSIDLLMRVPAPKLDFGSQIRRIHTIRAKKANTLQNGGSLLERVHAVMRQSGPRLTRSQKIKLSQIDEKFGVEYEQIRQTDEYKNAVSSATETAGDLRQIALLIMQDQSGSRTTKGKTYLTVYGHNLDEYRTRMDLTMEELADKIGISDRSVKSYIIEGVIPAVAIKNKIYTYITNTLRISIRALDLQENIPNIENSDLH